MKAINRTTKQQVKRGDTVVDFRGEKAIFDCATRVNETGRDGKVAVKVDGSDREYYARVYDLEVQETAQEVLNRVFPHPDDEADFAIGTHDSNVDMGRKE